MNYCTCSAQAEEEEDAEIPGAVRLDDDPLNVDDVDTSRILEEELGGGIELQSLGVEEGGIGEEEGGQEGEEDEEEEVRECLRACVRACCPGFGLMVWTEGLKFDVTVV